MRNRHAARSPVRTDFAAVALVLLACAVTSGHAQRDTRPNVVLIMADDLGYRELGCYGQRKIATPHLDRLAARGMRFTSFYAGSAVCAPSRCVLLTGAHTGHAAVRNNSAGYYKPTHPSGEGQYPLPKGTVTLAAYLKTAGYATCAIGKWGLGGPDDEGAPNAHGFDRWFGYLCQRQAHNYYPTHLWRDRTRVPLEGNHGRKTPSGRHYAPDLMIDEAVEWVDRCVTKDRARPFFLYYATPVPHVALQVPDDSLAKYADRFDETPYTGNRGYIPHPKPKAAYAAMITRLDRDLGRLFAKLDALGVADDTLILFTSDNGPTTAGGAGADFFESARPLRGKKGSLYEGGIRVPLIARWPGRIAPGTETDRACAAWDIFATIAAVVAPPETNERKNAAEATTGPDGVSFADTLLGEKTRDPSPERVLYWELGHLRAVRIGAWKGVKRRDRPLELYDLATDIGETKDVAAAHLDVVRRLEAAMTAASIPHPTFSKPPRRRATRRPNPRRRQVRRTETAPRPKPAPDAPNIVFLHADDLGWKDVGFMGCTKWRTPHLDALARTSVVFEQAYAAAPNCAPSRASMLLGQYTPRHGVYTVGATGRGPAAQRALLTPPNRRTLDENAITLGTALQRAGYRTGTFGKWHFRDDPRTRGFDVNVGGSAAGHPRRYFSPYGMKNLTDGPDGEHLCDRLSREVISFIEKNREGRFFAYVPFYSVHTPLRAKPDAIERVRRQTPTLKDKEATYGAMVETLDACIGRILTALDRCQLTDHTLVIFSSDNGHYGPVSSAAPLRGAKGMHYEGGLRIPLAIRWPGKTTPGRRINTPVTQIDLFPTLVGIAKANKPAQPLDGLNLTPLLRGANESPARLLGWHFPAYLPGRWKGQRLPRWRSTPLTVIRSGDLKLIEYYGLDGKTEIELFDLAKDVGETENLAKKRPDAAADMRAKLDAWRSAIKAPVPTERNPAYSGR